MWWSSMAASGSKCHPDVYLKPRSLSDWAWESMRCITGRPRFQRTRLCAVVHWTWMRSHWCSCTQTRPSPYATQGRRILVLRSSSTRPAQRLCCAGLWSLRKHYAWTSYPFSRIGKQVHEWRNSQHLSSAILVRIPKNIEKHNTRFIHRIGINMVPVWETFWAIHIEWHILKWNGNISSRYRKLLRTISVYDLKETNQMSSTLPTGTFKPLLFQIFPTLIWGRPARSTQSNIIDILLETSTFKCEG